MMGTVSAIWRWNGCLDHFTGNPRRYLCKASDFGSQGVLRRNCRKAASLYDVHLMSMLRERIRRKICQGSRPVRMRPYRMVIISRYFASVYFETSLWMRSCRTPIGARGISDSRVAAKRSKPIVRLCACLPAVRIAP